jgi:hypothetical protein
MLQARRHGDMQRSIKEITVFAGAIVLALLVDKEPGFEHPDHFYYYLPFIAGGFVSCIIMLALIVSVVKRMSSGAKPGDSSATALDNLGSSTDGTSIGPLRSNGVGYLDSMLNHLTMMHNPVLKAGYVAHLIGFQCAAIMLGLYGMQVYGTSDGFRWWYVAALLFMYAPIELIGRIYEFSSGGQGDIADDADQPQAQTGARVFTLSN